MERKKSTEMELRKINRSNIYHEFMSHNSLTKQDLVFKLNLSLPTITKNIDELLADKLIEKSGSQGNTGGRRATTYSLIRDARIALGIDVTRNHITITALDLTGTIITFRRYRLSFQSTDLYFQSVGKTLEAFIRDNHLDESRILGIGIGLPALVDADRRHVFFSKILPIQENILEDFKKYIPYRVDLFNDAKAAAFAETWGNPNFKNMFYLMLANNIGGSIIINHTIYSGDNQESSEAGHIQLVPGGRLCYCGQRGCVDTYISATVLSDLTDGNLEAFFRELRNGDPKLVEEWNTYLDHLAATVNTIHVLLDCNIVLGGYVGEYMGPYIDDLQARVVKLSTFCDNADFLKLCSYKKEAIAAGAAMRFIADFTDSV